MARDGEASRSGKKKKPPYESRPTCWEKTSFITQPLLPFGFVLWFFFSIPFPRNPPQEAFVMLRQALVSSTSSSSRALRAVARLSTSQPLLRPQFRATPAFSIRAFPPAISRWYSDGKASDEKPAEDEAAEKKSEEEGDKGGSDVLAQLRKDLEAKEAEARDWKVSIRECPAHHHGLADD